VTNGGLPTVFFDINWPKPPSGKGSTAISLYSDSNTNPVTLATVPYPATNYAIPVASNGAPFEPGSNYITGKFSTSGGLFLITNINAPGLMYTLEQDSTNIQGPWQSHLMAMTPIVAGMMPRKFTRLATFQSQWPQWMAILLSPTNDVTNVVSGSVTAITPPPKGNAK
jgi:hypothetical protein